MRTVAKEPVAAKAKVIRKVASLREMSLSQTIMKAKRKRIVLFSYFVHDFVEDAPVHNNGAKHGKDGAGDETKEVNEI